jgi:hypothetical protein
MGMMMKEGDSLAEREGRKKVNLSPLSHFTSSLLDSPFPPDDCLLLLTNSLICCCDITNPFIILFPSFLTHPSSSPTKHERLNFFTTSLPNNNNRNNNNISPFTRSKPPPPHQTQQLIPSTGSKFLELVRVTSSILTNQCARKE